jgi:hypothetical protein
MKHFRLFSLFTICLLLAHLAAAQTAETAVPAESTKGSAVLPAISGSGTTNYIPIWTSSSALGNSKLYQTGGHVGIGTTTPAYTLDVAGHINSSLDYRIGGFTVLYEPGGAASQNISLGYLALTNVSGTSNTAIGDYALEFNSTGSGNTACGSGALNVNSTGSNNTASGTSALGANTLGFENTANGENALGDNTSGNQNTAIGYYAGVGNGTGSNNIAIGYSSAENVSGGNSNNIHIGSLGSSGDSATIRIGTAGTQTSFFAAGIYGASSGSSGAIPVLVDSSGQLVTVSSSRRFKEDIQDMGDATSGLMKLRPVTFRYKKPLADSSQPIQYGLIAEEVAEIYPDLVSYAADGQIQSVKYQLLDPMLLNEVQRQHAEIQELQERLNKMEAALASLSRAPESR